MAIIKISEFDPTKVTFTIKNSNYGYNLYLGYNGRPGLVLQTPKMYTFGVKELVFQSKGETKTPTKSYVIDLSFKGIEANPELQQLHDKLCMVEQYAKEFMIKPENGQKLFGTDKYTIDYFDDITYRPIVRTPKKDGVVLPYPDTLALRLQTNDDQNPSMFYSNSWEKAPLLIFDKLCNKLDITPANAASVIPCGADVITIMEVSYFFINKFRCVTPRCRLLQAKVFKEDRVLSGYAIDDDNDVNNNDANDVHMDSHLDDLVDADADF